MHSQLESDIQLDASKFRSQAISERTRKFNKQLSEAFKRGPKWWEVGPEKYRKMRWNGETPFPKPVVLDSGKNITLPSRQPGRSIRCRIFAPKTAEPKGVFLHIHGGGWILNSEAYQDEMLAAYSSNSCLTVVSVGYRLAPEHPYPAGNEDCVDIGEYLVDHAERKFGAPLKFLGGDSAGGHLSALTCFKLLETRPDFSFKGLVLSYGAYDISDFLPSVRHFDLPLMLNLEIMQKYAEVYVPGRTIEQRRDRWISPLYADLNKMKLTSALFVCGTLDPLLDDSVLFSTKWSISGAESILKVYPGAPHGFTTFPIGKTETTEQSLDDIALFLNQRV